MATKDMWRQYCLPKEKIKKEITRPVNLESLRIGIVM